MDRVQKGQFGKRLAGVDIDEVVAMGRAFVDEQPRTFKALGDHLLTRWPDRDRFGLEQTVRTGVPLVQVPPRGLWGRSGPIAHTSIEAWLGDAAGRAADPRDDRVRRYLAAFGPASVMDAQAWCGLTKLARSSSAFGPTSLTFRDERGRELFDLPERAATRSRDPGPAALPVRLREHAPVVRRPVAALSPGGRPRVDTRTQGVAQHVHARRVRGRDMEGSSDRAPATLDDQRLRPQTAADSRPSPTKGSGSSRSWPPTRPSRDIRFADAGETGTEIADPGMSCTVGAVDVTIRER